MFSALRKLVAARHKNPAPDECIFSLDPQKRKLYLLDLKIVLRLPGARLALPNVANLETTIRRNHERIRIPYKAMLVLVKELQSVRHRVAPTSPLREIMSAIPGLAITVMRDALPTSPLMDQHDLSIRMPGLPRAEQEAEVERIRRLIAQKPAPQSHKPAAVPDAPAAAQPGNTAPHPDEPNMGALERRRFLDRSADHIESIALSTGELCDEDFAGYVDLCILNGDHARVIEMLVERLVERPRAWAWIRLLELLEAVRDPRFAGMRESFHAWVAGHCPELLPAPGGAETTIYGIRRDALRERENAEIGPHAMR